MLTTRFKCIQALIVAIFLTACSDSSTEDVPNRATLAQSIEGNLNKILRAEPPLRKVRIQVKSDRFEITHHFDHCPDDQSDDLPQRQVITLFLDELTDAVNARKSNVIDDLFLLDLNYTPNVEKDMWRAIGDLSHVRASRGELSKYEIAEDTLPKIDYIQYVKSNMRVTTCAENSYNVLPELVNVSFRTKELASEKLVSQISQYVSSSAADK